MSLPLVVPVLNYLAYMARVIVTPSPPTELSQTETSASVNVQNLSIMTNSVLIAVILLLAPALGSPLPVTTFGPDSQVSAQIPTPTTGYPVVVYENGYTSATYHGPYRGTPTTTGAANGPTTLAASIAPEPLNPTATYYNSKGYPINPLPAPYTPAGGLGTNGSLPRYMVESDFDFESIALGLYQEWIELDLFHDGLARFTDEEFVAAGLGPEAR